MNHGLSEFDLAPVERNALMDRAISDMRKTLALYRVHSALRALPAKAELNPCSEAAAGAFYLEKNV